MRGGGTRLGYHSRGISESSKRRRQRYSREKPRPSWAKYDAPVDESDWDDDEINTAC